MASSPEDRAHRRRLLKGVLVALILGNFFASFVFLRFNDDTAASSAAHAVHLQPQEDGDGSSAGPPTLASHAMDILDRRLAGLKRQVTHSVAWTVFKHVEERLGSDPKGINPQVLEAEVERAVAKHDIIQSGGGGGGLPSSGAEDDEQPRAGEVLDEDGLTGEQQQQQQEKDAESGATGHGKSSGKDGGSKLAAALKGRGDESKHNSKGSEVTASTDPLSVARNRNVGSKYSAFKASIASRTSRMKQLKESVTAAKGTASRYGGGHDINTVRANALNKMQERAAMTGSIKFGSSGSWLAETEKSLKPKDKYACSKLPLLQPPARGVRPHRAEAVPAPGPPSQDQPPAAGWSSSILGAFQSAAAPPSPAATPASRWNQDQETTLEASDKAVCSAKEMIHVAITINHEFQQGAAALIYSVLWNAACPSRVIFHVCHLENYSLDFILLFFPKLNYRSYIVDGASMKGAIRGMDYRGKDLENPLNYVRINLPHILPTCVKKFIYVDTDTLMLGRIEDMFATDVSEHVIGSPENCEYKLESYFTKDFWANKTLSNRFKREKKDCYFNPGVMVVNADAWRKTGATKSLLHWMSVQKHSAAPLYTLGSLPPFLLVFAGDVAHMGMAWNEHDLGCGCGVIPVPAKARLLHWSCGGKPWRRIKDGAPCVIDTAYWQPYDLIGKIQPSYWCDDGDLPEKLEHLGVAWPSRNDEGDTPEKDIPEGMETVMFEQVFNRPKKRKCPGPVHIPLLGHLAEHDGPS